MVSAGAPRPGSGPSEPLSFGFMRPPGASRRAQVSPADGPQTVLESTAAPSRTTISKERDQRGLSSPRPAIEDMVQGSRGATRNNGPASPYSKVTAGTVSSSQTRAANPEPLLARGEASPSLSALAYHLNCPDGKPAPGL